MATPIIRDYTAVNSCFEPVTFNRKRTDKTFKYCSTYLVNNGRGQTIVKRFLKGPQGVNWFETVGKGVEKVGDA